MNALIKIENVDVPIVEIEGRRVITLAMVDKVHQRPEGTASRNFRKNRQRFIDIEDYLQMSSDEIRRNNPDAIPSALRRNDVILLTESGYLMLVKSFTDDLAWEVQRQLVKSYFRTKSETAPSVPAVQRDVGQLAWDACHELWPLLRNELARRGGAAMLVIVDEEDGSTIRALTADETLTTHGELNRIARVLLAALPCALIPLQGQTPYVDSIIREIQGVLERH